MATRRSKRKRRKTNARLEELRVLGGRPQTDDPPAGRRAELGRIWRRELCRLGHEAAEEATYDAVKRELDRRRAEEARKDARNPHRRIKRNLDLG